MADHTPDSPHQNLQPNEPVVHVEPWAPASAGGPERPPEVELPADQPKSDQHESIPPQPQPTPDEIAVDEGWDNSDYNSDGTSFMTQLSSSIANYTWENGRRYHAYQEGRYPLPNDESELDREDMKHHEWMIITGFRLHFAPISATPEKILDLGTGTGIWAIQMAEKYPNTEVIGIDLSPIQPQWVPPNLTFEIDDIEAPWLHKPDSYDLINIRFMFLAIRDYPTMIRQAFSTLKPGGYIELSELDLHPQPYDSQFAADSRIVSWLENMHLAAMKMGLDFYIARRFKGMLEEAGFEAITEEIFEVPWGGWPKDQRLKAIGHWHLEQLKQGLQGIAMALLTRSLGWRPEEVEVFLVGLRKELNDKSIHILDHAHVVYGRKPLHTRPLGFSESPVSSPTPQLSQTPQILQGFQSLPASQPSQTTQTFQMPSTTQALWTPETPQPPLVSQTSQTLWTAPASQTPETPLVPPISQGSGSVGSVDPKA